MRHLALAAALLIAAVASAEPPAPATGEKHEHASFLDQAGETPGLAPWEPLPLLTHQRQWLPLIRKAVSGPDAVTRRRGLFVLGCLWLPDSRPLARPALRDKDRLVRMQAAVTLCLSHDPKGLPGATAALREGPPWLRLYALEGLWRLNTAAAQDALHTTRGGLDPLLQSTLDQALKTAPRPLRLAPNRQLPAPRSLYDLWLTVADSFILESDYWWHKGDYDQSIRCQQTALFFDPTSVDAFTNVAWLQWSMGRHEEAIATYRQAIAANPQSWEAADALGQYYLRHGEKELGVRYLHQAATLGSPPIPRRVLGHALQAQGRTQEALQVWKDILQMDPNDPIAKRQIERLQAK
jgi:tetratricopeptide (TPR) repeat protein